MLEKLPATKPDGPSQEQRREARLVDARCGRLVWMDAEEAAAYLNYPLGTFNTLAGKGEIPRHKRGAGWRYHRDELEEWLLAA